MNVAAIIRQARSRPWNEVPWRTKRVLQRVIGKWIERARVRGNLMSVSSRDLRRALTVEPENAIANVGRIRLGRMNASGEARSELSRGFKERHPEVFKALLDDAENALARRFDLLGSGPTDLGPSIDWSRDFKTGFRWPHVYVKDMVLVDPAFKADVKVPWDLSRGYQLIRLGQAFWLTGEERFAREAMDQWASWVDGNPVLRTCNWGNAMEAAIRAANWCVAFTLTRDSAAQTAAIRERFLRSALEHGRFIAANLERSEGYPTSNHYLADLVGLVYLAILAPHFKESAAWLETGLRGLESETLIQVGADGLDYEGSINYHRLVGELLLSAFQLARENGHAPSEVAWKRVLAMAEATLHYTRPDGRAPLIGDVDNGRLHWLTPEPSDDHRSFLGLAASVTGRPDFAAAAGRAGAEGFWWADVPSGAPADLPRLTSKLFENAGLAVLRGDGAQVVVHCGAPRGPRGHFHNDALSLEVSLSGLPWIVDPGTYAYTSSESDRNHFRQTRAHNTVQIDQAEINEIVPGQLFDLRFASKPRVVEWTVTEDATTFVGEHLGYARLRGGGAHQRRITLHRSGALEVEDTIQGEGSHVVESFLHLDPGVRAERAGNALILTRVDGPARLRIEFASPAGEPTLAIEPDWIARGYGKREPALVIRTSAQTTLPWKQSMRLTVMS